MPTILSRVRGLLSPIYADEPLRLTDGGGGSSTLSAQLDAAFGNTLGMILYRGVDGWAALAAGAAGNVLQTEGTSGDPSWVIPRGGAGGGSFITSHDVTSSREFATTYTNSTGSTIFLSIDVSWSDAGNNVQILVDGATEDTVISNGSLGYTERTLKAFVGNGQTYELASFSGSNTIVFWKERY